VGAGGEDAEPIDDPSLHGLPSFVGHSPLLYLAVALVPGIWWLLFKHPLGVRCGRRGRIPRRRPAPGSRPT
jgi:ABC-type uncharacterized transport system permease subunit